MKNLISIVFKKISPDLLFQGEELSYFSAIPLNFPLSIKSYNLKSADNNDALELQSNTSINII